MNLRHELEIQCHNIAAIQTLTALERFCRELHAAEISRGMEARRSEEMAAAIQTEIETFHTRMPRHD
jgi:hypothetical protein